MSNPHWLRVSALAALVVSAAPSAEAAAVRAQVFLSPQVLAFLSEGPGPQTAGGSASGPFNTTASGTTVTNWLQSTLNGTVSGVGDTVGYALVQDTVMITAPGIATNTIGQITFGVLLYGGVSVSNEDRATVGWFMNADLGGGAYDISMNGVVFNPSFPTPGLVGDPLALYTGTGTFQFGVAEPLEVNFRLEAQADELFSGPDVFGTASFDVGMCWGGISGVTVGGSAVSNFSISSESGTNYRDAANCTQGPGGAVPTSGTLPLALAAFGGLVAVGRKRRTPN